MRYDVAVIGGGPGGSTVASFLKKYRPELTVVVLERERFPRDHVGESQLPLIGRILDELGVWNQIESAGFPIKVGATYRWGKTDSLWDFHFVADGNLIDEPRPAAFNGQRTLTAFQVDRAIYDTILLDHSASLGVEVRQETSVREVLRDGDSVLGLKLGDDSLVLANHYVDASGHAGMLRRAMKVETEAPSNLHNIAIWDYWRNAEWAVDIGVGGTRVQVMSVKFGWLWFIPLGPDRTSIGLVCPADYYKKCGLSPEELYVKAISEEPRIADLVSNGFREDNLQTTKDWSFIAERAYGENWSLVGEALGFADPILAAGMTLTHVSARECAFTILESFHDLAQEWLWKLYEEKNLRRLRQHIRFADYWYTANANFSDLREFTSEIARDAGLDLNAEKAFQWLGTGGFVEDDMGIGGLGTVSIKALHQLTNRMSEEPTQPFLDGKNNFELISKGAELAPGARYSEGRVQKIQLVRRGSKTLPLTGYFGMIVDALQKSSRADDLICFVEIACVRSGIRFDSAAKTSLACCLEAMIRDGWILSTTVKDVPLFSFRIEGESSMISNNRDLSRTTLGR